jgi:hypothetical protein
MSLSKPKRTLLIFKVLGPVGSGKSTIAGAMSILFTVCRNIDTHGDILLVPTDGDDIPDIGKDMTMKSGKHRNDLTCYSILDTIRSGNIPVYSGGGGAVSNLNKYLENIIDEEVDIKYVVFVPSEVDDITLLTDGPTYLKNMYSDDASVSSAVRRRLRSGEWTLTPNQTEDEFCKFICKSSYNNMRFAKKSCEEAEFVFGFPRLSGKDFNERGVLTKMIDFDIVFDAIAPIIKYNYRFKEQPQLMCTFTWIGMLVDLSTQSKLGHFTVYRHPDKIKQPCSSTEFQTLSRVYDEYKEFIPGSEISMSSKETNNKITFAIIGEADKRYDYSTHSTINPGDHEPGQMKVAAAAYNCYSAHMNALGLVYSVDKKDISETVKKVSDYMLICDSTLNVYTPYKKIDIFLCAHSNVLGCKTIKDINAVLEQLPPINTTVALPVRESKDIKRGEMIEYDMTSTKSIPCKIKVVSSFGY